MRAECCKHVQMEAAVLVMLDPELPIRQFSEPGVDMQQRDDISVAAQ